MPVNDEVLRALSLGPDASRAERTIDITTTGRRTGQPRRIEIWFHRVDGRWFISGMPAPRSWYANVRANPRFTFHLKHEVHADLPATAKAVAPATRERVIAAVVSLQDQPNLERRVTQRQNLSVWLAHAPLIEVVFDDERLQALAAAGGA